MWGNLDWSVDMNSDFENFELLDLLIERQIQLKRMFENRWNEYSDIPMSYSEWYILSRIYKKQLTIASVTRHLQITRQATHKLIKKMESKGLVEVTQSNNRRDKSIRLTALGERCYEKQLTIKIEIENMISQKIGEDELERLKNILKSDWGL